MRVTQFDIAKLANVSQATVSRVLSGDDRVEDIIRERVVEVMRAQNYQPDVRARSLRTRRTGLIGLVLKRPHGGLTDDPFFSALTGGIIDYLCGKPYHLCVDLVTDDKSQEGVYDEMLRTRRVDGLILVEPEAYDERIELLQQDKFPFVLIGNPRSDGIASVDNDNVLAGEMATKHLLEAGYRKIGFLGTTPGIAVSDDRIDGYTAAMDSFGQEKRIYHSDFGMDAARTRAREIFASSSAPDALVVLDDFMAFGVMLASRESKRTIPTSLGLVSFMDSSLCHLVEGGLTSVNLGIEQMVRIAVSKLLSIIEGEEVTQPREVVPCRLIARGSSARA